MLVNLRPTPDLQDLNLSNIYNTETDRLMGMFRIKSQAGAWYMNIKYYIHLPVSLTRLTGKIPSGLL